MLKNMSISIVLLLFTVSTQSIENSNKEETLRSRKCEKFCCIEISGNQHIGGNLTVGGDITAGNLNVGSTNAGDDLIINDQSIAALFDIGFFSFGLDQETTRAISPVTVNPGDSLAFPTVNISSAITAISDTQFSLPKVGTYNLSAVISLATTDGMAPVDPIQFAVRIDGDVVPFTVLQDDSNAETQLVINNVLINVATAPAILDVNNIGTTAFNFTQGALFIQRISNIPLV